MRIVEYVQVIDGKCESSELCGNKSCRYYHEFSSDENYELLEEASKFPSQRKPKEVVEFECKNFKPR